MEGAEAATDGKQHARLLYTGAVQESEGAALLCRPSYAWKARSSSHYHHDSHQRGDTEREGAGAAMAPVHSEHFTEGADEARTGSGRRNDRFSITVGEKGPPAHLHQEVGVIICRRTSCCMGVGYVARFTAEA